MLNDYDAIYVVSIAQTLLHAPRRICNRRCFFVGLSVCLFLYLSVRHFVYLLATLRKKLLNGFAENFQDRLAMG